MTRGIPTSIGLLSLSVASVGCSDAHKFASTAEKVCKEQCECPEALEDWNEVKYCKQACEGYATSLEAWIADSDPEEPCAEFDDLLGDLRGCTESSCGDARDICLATVYTQLYSCWEFFSDGYYYTPYGEMAAEGITPGEIVRHMLEPIPEGLGGQTLYAAD
ncbi:hypothetical protein G6O69_13860 [Pseudenhygromyxa sp. WMMC2535]|uniref:hypothetical protein n=1 Tax=Pseudenhygromyxa sp. WMMC2535 TaxID=2712867 RepID=UPI00155165FD|nr:hypothetical protein [Pseudenhygromyxa sp. WMMC2535]NVB38922.1 hypothetical protein [Pseudenhygromyxa sp. WMMC2535]